MASMALVSPEQFNVGQKKYVEAMAESVRTLSSHTDMVMVVKDIHSRFLAATDAFAIQFAGLPRGADAVGRLDREMPCKGIAQLADTFVREDQALMRSPDSSRKKSFFGIFDLDSGLYSQITDKYPLVHTDSQSILGIVCISRKIELANFLAMVPEYFLDLGVELECNIENATGPMLLGGINLTGYEHEVSFLIALNWELEQIARFMDEHGLVSGQAGADSIQECHRRLCEKFDCHPARLRELLIELGIHQKMPDSFFRRLVGSWPL